MQELNESLFFLINSGFHSNLNDLWLGNATYLGNGWVAFPIAIFLLALIDRPNFARDFAMLALAAIVGGLLVAAAKSLLDSPRPLAYYQTQIALGRVQIHVMFEPLYGRSFPSGHTQTAFTIAGVFAWLRNRRPSFWPATSIVAFGLAAIVGISRVYVGAHFPLDVLGGAVLGLLATVIAANLHARIFPSNSNRVVQERPTPVRNHLTS